jgi:hypothetical protein
MKKRLPTCPVGGGDQGDESALAEVSITRLPAGVNVVGGFLLYLKLLFIISIT